MYEQNMVPAIFEPFAKGLLELAGLHEGEHVLDVACGTGIVSRLAWRDVAPSGGLVGLDVNPEMLDVASGKTDKGAVIEWKEGDAASMPFPNGEFDVVICQHGVQYFPDRQAALTEMHRVLRATAGRLIFSVWRPIQFNPGHYIFAKVLDRRIGEQAGETRRAPFKLSDRQEIRTLVTESGFRDIVVHLDTRVARFPSAEAMARIMVAGTPLATALENADSAVMQTVISEVAEGLSDYIDDQGLALPMQAWVITANA